jgi:hypothetical protein
VTLNPFPKLGRIDGNLGRTCGYEERFSEFQVYGTAFKSVQNAAPLYDNAFRKSGFTGLNFL